MQFWWSLLDNFDYSVLHKQEEKEVNEKHETNEGKDDED